MDHGRTISDNDDSAATHCGRIIVVGHERHVLSFLGMQLTGFLSFMQNLVITIWSYEINPSYPSGQ
jgi:hypothetical protein